MAKRRKLRLSKTAQGDIEKIDYYSFEKWGAKTANAYMAGLEARLTALLETPLLGIDRSDLRPDCRARVSGSHVIYYRIEDEFIYILTILHHSQDHEAFLHEAAED
ncbi:type II toxin-antitoxin system RelE/ParE family toxin [Hyphococcus sp.]|uniref:type II toxin-antitoxin system RelE/ParE family toxin n=1 Tax=Hyphococcus sp. TaxID=2038636 RepID=UPI003CCC1900